MRGETIFFPPRTSMTSSVGTMTRPILSARPNAVTRPSRLSLTFFSKPEYVWMMYQFFATAILRVPEFVQNQLNQPSKRPVHHKEKRAEKENGHDHNQRLRPHVDETRPGYVSHLPAHVVQELAKLLPGDGDALEPR